jgi:DNA replication protein DnaC
VSGRETSRTEASLPMLLRSFKLPAFVRDYGTLADRAAAEGLSHAEYLLALAEVEAAERQARRTARLLEESKLPREKTLGSYQLERLTAKVRASFATLREGSFLERAVNVIVFGSPGTGSKSGACAHRALRGTWET